MSLYELIFRGNIAHPKIKYFFSINCDDGVSAD